MRIQDFTAPLTNHGDHKAVVVNNDTVETTNAKTLFGHCCRRASTKDKHRATITAFVEAVRQEQGDHCANLAAHLLRQRHYAGKPLRKYMITDILRALATEHQSVSKYNEKVTSLPYIHTYLQGRPDTANLPPEDLDKVAKHISSQLQHLWFKDKSPLPPRLLDQVSLNVLRRSYSCTVITDLLRPTREGGSQGWKNYLNGLHQKHGFSYPELAQLKRHVLNVMSMDSWITPLPRNERQLMDSLHRGTFPGMQALIDSLISTPDKPSDSVTEESPLSTIQRAWLDAHFPEPSPARLLVFKHGQAIFERAPEGHFPRPSDIWQCLFKDFCPQLNTLSVGLASKIDTKVEEVLCSAAKECGILNVDLEKAAFLYCCGLTGTQAIIHAKAPTEFNLSHYTQPPLPFPSSRLEELGQYAEEQLGTTLGNYISAASITFTTTQGTAVFPIHAPHHAMPQGSEDAPPTQEILRLTSQYSVTQEQRTCLLLLLGERGTAHLRTLTQACPPSCSPHAGCHTNVTKAGENLIVRHALTANHTFFNREVRGDVEYIIRPNGTYTMSEMKLTQADAEMTTEDLIRAFCRCSLHANSSRDLQIQGGLRGTVERLLTTWRLDTSFAPLLSDFLAKTLPVDFKDQKNLTLPNLDERIMELKVTGLAELLHSLGASVPASPSFNIGNLLSSYDTISPQDKAWMVRLIGRGPLLVLGFQHLQQIKTADPSAPPFTAKSYWQGVFGTPPPRTLTEENLPRLAQEYFDEQFRAQLGDLPETIIHPDSRGSSRSFLKDMFLMNGLSHQAAIDCATHHRGVRRGDFAALPVLISPASIPSESDCLARLGLSLNRRGLGSDPSITFHDPHLGSNTIHLQHHAELSREERAAFENGEINSPAMLRIIQHAGNMCATKLQRQALYLALGQTGVGCFRRLCRAADPELSLDEHSSYTMNVHRLGDGSLEVTINTTPDCELSGRILWHIDQAGVGRCMDLAVTRPRPGDTERQRRVRFNSVVETRTIDEVDAGSLQSQ